MIKTFFGRIDESLDEASLKGNVGIPGEGGDKKGKKYLSDVERRAEERNRELQRRHGQDIPRFMGLVSKARQIQAGHEKELEELAVEAIKARYGSILDGVELDIKFPKSGEIRNMMKDVPDKSECKDCSLPSLKKLEDEGIISAIQKRKIANNITQGEAKNTKTCLNMEDVVEGFHKIFGREKGEEYRDLLNKITSIAGFFDWAIPMEVQQEMWERDKSGFSGSVKVEWETPEADEEEEDEEDLAQKILKSLEEDDDLPEEETEELFKQTTPVIHALGSDFAMLIHEAVKGIYQLISANAIPKEDTETAETIIDNTDSLADEIEDLRYGPEIAADLRDFINKFKESDEIENLREHVFGKMMLMEPKAFLDLMYKILNQDPTAKKPMQEIIDEVKKEIADYDLADAGIEPDEDSEEIAAIKAGAKEEPEGEVDYSELSPREIQAMVDKALDAGDYDTVRKLTPYLKESKKQGVFERMHAQMGYPSNE